MTWIPLRVRRDKNFLRLGERFLENHVTDELKKIEEQYGAIKFVLEVERENDKNGEFTSYSIQVADNPSASLPYPEAGLKL